MPTGNPPAAVVVRDSDYCVATWGDVFIVIWRQETRLDAARGLDALLAAFGKERPRGCGLLTVVEQDAPMPTSEVRAAIAKFLNNGGGTIKSSAVAFEGTGFRAAAVRGVVTGLTMLARQPYPHRVFATVQDALTWLSSSLRETAQLELDANSLVEELRALRERIAKA
jgi:hypothetical protein